jgi:gliding motility-associated lipoprotein GldH
MTERKNRGSWLLLLALTVITFACSRNIVFTDTYTIPGRTWKLNDVPEFKVQVDDTVSAHNIMIMIRTGSKYPFGNIFLFVTAVNPRGETITDTMQYYLADEKGNWRGKGFGDIHALNLPYKSNIYFPAKGTYSFRIRHGMRSEDLKGVYDVGLKVEKIRIKRK